MLKIAYRPLADLKPYTRNARTHSPKQIEALKRSLLAFGWTTPMIVAGKDMIAGHGRLMAALALQAEGKKIPNHADPAKGPCVDVSHLDAAARRAYIIADNKLALQAGWDQEILAAELSDLRAAGADLELTGFSVSELKRVVDGERGHGLQEVGAGRHLLMIEFESEPALNAAFTELSGERGWNCKVLS
jgi:ParB-like chromosome segregation protein Spo0J